MRKRMLLVSVLFLVALAWTTATVNAAKITLEKEIVFSDEGEFLGYEDPDPSLLTHLGFTIIADYPSYLAGEVREEDLDDLSRVGLLTADFLLITLIGCWHCYGNGERAEI